MPKRSFSDSPFNGAPLTGLALGIDMYLELGLGFSDVTPAKLNEKYQKLRNENPRLGEIDPPSAEDSENSLAFLETLGLHRGFKSLQGVDFVKNERSKTKDFEAEKEKFKKHLTFVLAINNIEYDHSIFTNKEKLMNCLALLFGKISAGESVHTKEGFELSEFSVKDDLDKRVVVQNHIGSLLYFHHKGIERTINSKTRIFGFGKKTIYSKQQDIFYKVDGKGLAVKFDEWLEKNLDSIDEYKNIEIDLADIGNMLDRKIDENGIKKGLEQFFDKYPQISLINEKRRLIRETLVEWSMQLNSLKGDEKSLVKDKILDSLRNIAAISAMQKFTDRVQEHLVVRDRVDTKYCFGVKQSPHKEPLGGKEALKRKLKAKAEGLVNEYKHVTVAGLRHTSGEQNERLHEVLFAELPESFWQGTDLEAHAKTKVKVKEKGKKVRQAQDVAKAVVSKEGGEFVADATFSIVTADALGFAAKYLPKGFFAAQRLIKKKLDRARQLLKNNVMYDTDSLRYMLMTMFRGEQATTLNDKTAMEQKLRTQDPMAAYSSLPVLYEGNIGISDPSLVLNVRDKVEQGSSAIIYIDKRGILSPAKEKSLLLGKFKHNMKSLFEEGGVINVIKRPDGRDIQESVLAYNPYLSSQYKLLFNQNNLNCFKILLAYMLGVPELGLDDYQKAKTNGLGKLASLAAASVDSYQIQNFNNGNKIILQDENNTCISRDDLLKDIQVYLRIDSNTIVNKAGTRQEAYRPKPNTGSNSARDEVRVLAKQTGS